MLVPVKTIKAFPIEKEQNESYINCLYIPFKVTNAKFLILVFVIILHYFIDSYQLKLE